MQCVQCTNRVDGTDLLCKACLAQEAAAARRMATHGTFSAPEPIADSSPFGVPTPLPAEKRLAPVISVVGIGLVAVTLGWFGVTHFVSDRQIRTEAHARADADSQRRKQQLDATQQASNKMRSYMDHYVESSVIRQAAADRNMPPHVAATGGSHGPRAAATGRQDYRLEQAKTELVQRDACTRLNMAFDHAFAIGSQLSSTAVAGPGAGPADASRRKKELEEDLREIHQYVPFDFPDHARRNRDAMRKVEGYLIVLGGK